MCWRLCSACLAGGILDGIFSCGMRCDVAVSQDIQSVSMPAMILKLSDPRNWPLGAFILSAMMLAAAHAFERFALLAPCPLCLRQREVYWAALALAAIGYTVVRFTRSSRLNMTVNVLLSLVFLTGMVIASYHAGVEWGVFDAPAECVALETDVPLIASQVDLDKAYAVPSCGEVPWQLLGISMAGYNAILSLMLAAISAVFAARAVTSARGALTPVP